nr:sugar ABC transporter permease [Faecalicatena faecalis]
MTPIMILFFVFSVIPIIYSVVMSLFNYNGFPHPPFVGIKNYVMLFHDSEFLGALKNTVFFVVIAVVLNICIATFLAVLVKSLKKTKLRGFFRGWFFLPAVVPMVAVCYVWLIMFDPANGIINQVLMLLGMGSPVNWLNDTRTALMCIVVVTLWCDLGYNLVIIMAGLDSIPATFLEAAQIDGANSVYRFFKITLPLMARNMMFVGIMTSISYFQVFAQVQIMTQGGPDNGTNVIGLNIYNYAFRYSQMGYASAMAVVMLGIILVISLVQLKLGKTDWEY